jgi:hypothetical protein
MCEHHRLLITDYRLLAAAPAEPLGRSLALPLPILQNFANLSKAHLPE